MKHSKIRLSVVASALLALSFTACGGGGDEAAPTSATSYAIFEGAGAVDVKERFDANDSLVAGTTTSPSAHTDFGITKALPTPYADAAALATATTHTLTGDMAAPAAIPANSVVKIDGAVTITSGNLQIGADSVVYGDATSFLVIAKGAQITADGGNDAGTITFTSDAALTGTAPAAGQWGGLTILGDATTNHVNPFYEIDETKAEYAFGGTNDTHDGGILNYVRILNSGYAVAANQEVNGLSLAGVGSGTTVTNILVDKSGDDGIEIWGGTVNVSNVTITDAQDDSFDADYGYTGTVTNLTINNPLKAGMEISSGGTNPMTSPTIIDFKVNAGESSEGGIYIKDDTTAPTFISGTVDSNTSAVAGDVHTKVALSKDAKAALAFRDVTFAQGTASFSGNGAADVKTRIQAATKVIFPAVPTAYADAAALATATTHTLTGDIAGTDLTGNSVIKIDGAVTITSGNLVIPAGAVVYGDSTSYLVIGRDAQITANGSASSPITFTSSAALTGTAPAAGQWGGLTILGKATTNHTNAVYEINESAAKYAFGQHDGTGTLGLTIAADDTQNSGILNYVRILNSGYAVAANQEVNGLSLAGVGSGTTVTNILVDKSGDDGIEIWGGTVELTNVTIIDAQDDSFDADYGYTGTVTNLFVKQETAAHAGFEISSGGDNPMTGLKIIDFTINTVAASDEGGIYIKDDTTAPVLVNGYINHLGKDGHVNAKLVPTTAAKAAMEVKDITFR